MNILVFLSLCLVVAFGQVTRTKWSYCRYPPVATSIPGGIHGNTAYYATAPAIPAEDATVWTPCGPDQWCPDPDELNIRSASRLPGCWTMLDWSMFQTIVTVDSDTTLTEFTVTFNWMDDGCEVWIFNTDYPDGISCGNVFLGQTATVDFSTKAVIGENRLVIVQVDDCAVENNIDAVPSLNGDVVHLCPSDDPCISSTWDNDLQDCVSGPNPANPPCDDGNSCTQTDVCNDGVCVGSNPVVCEQPSQCQKVSCDTNTGQCVTVMDTGCPCDDGDKCTQTDVCNNGVCVGSYPVYCSVSDQCQSPGTCDPTTGKCSPAEELDGGGCDDGNACTQTDTCKNGVCLGSDEVVCEADACEIPGTCEPHSGVCSAPVKLSDCPCDDDNACTQTDTCSNGVCLGSDEVICNCASQCQEPGTCDTTTGLCSPPENLDDSCDDGNACTQTDTCKNGVCVGSKPMECPQPDGHCQVAGTCNPATGECTDMVMQSFIPCDDGNACTQSDTCLNGTCVGTDVSCSVANQCQQPGTCDTITGQCSAPKNLTGGTCNDGNACTQSDSCQNGVCTGYNPVQCTCGSQCQVAGVCNPTTGVCSSAVMLTGNPCNDNNACTQNDTCQLGSCQGSNPVMCPLALQCQVAGVCNPTTGKCAASTHQKDGTACDDGNACTQSDTCESGKCQGGTTICCKATKCGLCVDECGKSDYLKVLNFYGIKSGTVNNVSNGGGLTCPGKQVCCSPKNPPQCYYDISQGICVVDNSVAVQ